MIATIAVIAEKKKSSAIAAIIAIIWKPLSSDRSDNDQRRKHCEESRWLSQSAFVRPLAMSCLNRCQDLVGS